MNKRVIKIFVGYQIDSEFHTSDEIKEIMCGRVAPLVEAELGISLEFKFGNKFRPGEYLFSQVNDAIHQSEIAIFDVSENNPNVLIEVGLAYGARKHTILLKNSISKDKYKVPSDIGAFIYLTYEKIDQIVDDLIGSIVTYYHNHIPSHFYFKELWGFYPNDTVYIVCPELGEPDIKQNPELNEFLYLGKYGDIDSFVVLFASISKLFPNINLIFCTGKEFKALPGNPHSENLILLGGPDYNEVTRYYIEKKKVMPYEFVERDAEMEEIGIKHAISGAEYYSNFDTEDELKCITDYGFFIKIKNPSNNRKKLFMISGIHTYGVYGAAKSFSLHANNECDIARDNCNKVISTVGNDSCFAVLFPVDCVNNQVGTPAICEQEIIGL